MVATTASARPGSPTYRLPFVIGASAAGTIIEWYDFYLYGVLAAFFCTQFFPKGNDTAALLASLATFGAGLRRPPVRRGVLRPDRRHHRPQVHVPRDDHGHGRLDRAGRPPADVRPDRHPRADHPRASCASPRAWRSAASTAARRSTSPSTAPTTSAARTRAGSRRPRRSACCWRWSSSASSGPSMSAERLHELRLADPVPAVGRSWSSWRCTSGCGCRRRRCSPSSRQQGKSSTLALARELRQRGEPQADPARAFGATAGQAVVWYQGQFQALFFLGTNLGRQVPGRVPDRGHGDRARDAVLRLLRAAVGPDRAQAGDPRRLPDRGDHLLPDLQPDDPVRPPAGHAGDQRRQRRQVRRCRRRASTVAQPEILPLIALVWIQVVFVTMVYGPIAAFLVEFFPARIRYTSLSIPYHLGNGWFGGFLPLIAAAPAGRDRQPLRRPDLPDHGRADHGGHRRPVHPGDPARADLGRGRRASTTTGRRRARRRRPVIQGGGLAG